MDFENKTDFAAQLFRSEFEHDHMYNSLLVRRRFSITNRTSLEPTSGPADIRREIIRDPYGTIMPDIFFWGPPTDLIVAGDAVAPDLKAVDQSRVMIKADSGSQNVYELQIRISGQRIWERSLTGNLVPSKPVPFSTIPLTYDNAFGGTVENEYGTVPFADNPIGKGYYLKEKDAEYNPLPNIEDVSDCIKKWNDHPQPVGCAPYSLQWGMRALSSVTTNDSKLMQFTPQKGFFNHAYPYLSGKELKTGDRITISGMHSEGDISFILCNDLQVTIGLGSKIYTRKMQIQEIYVDIIKMTVDISYRLNYDYTFVAHQRRLTVLTFEK